MPELLLDIDLGLVWIPVASIEVNIDCKQNGNDSFVVNKLEKCKSYSGVKQNRILKTRRISFLLDLLLNSPVVLVLRMQIVKSSAAFTSIQMLS